MVKRVWRVKRWKKCFVCSAGKDDKGNFIVYNIIECEPDNASNNLFCYAGNHAFTVYDNKITECKSISSKEAYMLAKKLKMMV